VCVRAFIIESYVMWSVFGIWHW